MGPTPQPPLTTAPPRPQSLRSLTTGLCPPILYPQNRNSRHITPHIHPQTPLQNPIITPCSHSTLSLSQEHPHTSESLHKNTLNPHTSDPPPQCLLLTLQTTTPLPPKNALPPSPSSPELHPYPPTKILYPRSAPQPTLSPTCTEWTPTSPPKPPVYKSFQCSSALSVLPRTSPIPPG